MLGLNNRFQHTYDMPKGRPPRPTKLQVELRGDPSKCRGNTIEPDAPKGWSDCPQHVQDDRVAHDEWQSICTQLESMDLLSTIDGCSNELHGACDREGPRVSASTDLGDGKKTATQLLEVKM